MNRIFKTAPVTANATTFDFHSLLVGKILPYRLNLPAMFQLAYASSTKALLSAADIANILVVSREKNRKHGITGMLLYKNKTVLQVIEGEKDAVLSLFEIIRKNERHSNVMELYRKNIKERDFPEWTMGVQDLNADSVRNLEGFDTFLDPNAGLNGIKSTAATKLLNYFKTHVRSPLN